MIASSSNITAASAARKLLTGVVAYAKVEVKRVGPEVTDMPEKQTLERARRARRQGKAPSTQAGEFVREEVHHVREGKHGARSTKQVIAIGLSKARRAGVKLPPQGKTARRSARTPSRRRRAVRA